MLIVQKYGGSSLQGADRIRSVAERVLTARHDGHDVVVVCSAMGDTSDELIDLAQTVSSNRPAREMDMLLTSGERVSNALVAMAVHNLGGTARSLSGAQAGIYTDGRHGAARIVEVSPTRVREVLDQGAVPFVSGFQGIFAESGDLTTLGRGGSDVTAVALAAALSADLCEIYTDVDGVFTADPRLVACARLLDAVSTAEMLEMAAAGAKVLMPRCAAYAYRHDVAIHVRSSFTGRPGTLVSNAVEVGSMEGSCVTGVAHTRAVAQITVSGASLDPMATSELFDVLAQSGITVDMVQRSGPPTGHGVAFIVPGPDGPRALELLKRQCEKSGHGQVRCDSGMSQVSLVGVGIGSERADVVARLCRTLAEDGIGIGPVAASELRVSALCPADRLDDAVRALHRAFGLDGATVTLVDEGAGR
ncbi:aspartate kinase [Streptomyces candidus]|uniref:Aspartokinase n=1 Tax=Streptomyces candidus TaxID=67283 RepID=A0A7X0LTW6_9ACTN|nr:aspartate kinase [Streptomyces candidus]MBB6439471.1 aspartate kinase [Streptomyces candidus]GHH56537.1 aspartokinase [Streptomyces candidus]